MQRTDSEDDLALSTLAVTTRLGPARPPRSILSVLLAVLLLGACRIPISYYDAATYRNLTDLKVECTSLVERFGTDTPPPIEDVQRVQLEFDKAYEYEKGKGNDNSDTARSFEKVRELWEEDVSDFEEELAAAPDDKLGRVYFEQAAVALGQAFDIAIATENLKNKDKN